jgi:putative flippase GtrA
VLLLAHVCAVPTAFVLYRRAVFRVHGHVWRDLARFELVNLTAFAANLVLLPLAIEVVGLPAFPAQIAVTVALVFVTFFGHRYFSFRRPAAPAGEQ